VTEKKTRNSEVLADFVKYCNEHPTDRFWQALRNWSGYGFIHADTEDTFYWKGKDH
jgi:hypothetical protein